MPLFCGQEISEKFAEKIGLHPCTFKTASYAITGSVTIYKNWCGNGPLMIADGATMFRITYCPVCGENLSIN